MHLGFYSFNRILETSPCHFLLKVITFANTPWISAASAISMCSSSTLACLLPSLSRCSFNFTTSSVSSNNLTPFRLRSNKFRKAVVDTYVHCSSHILKNCLLSSAVSVSPPSSAWDSMTSASFSAADQI